MCDCKLCQRTKILKEVIESRDIDQLIKLVEKYEDVLSAVELENEFLKNPGQCPGS